MSSAIVPFVEPLPKSKDLKSQDCEFEFAIGDWFNVPEPTGLREDFNKGDLFYWYAYFSNTARHYRIKYMAEVYSDRDEMQMNSFENEAHDEKIFILRGMMEMRIDPLGPTREERIIMRRIIAEANDYYYGYAAETSRKFFRHLQLHGFKPTMFRQRYQQWTEQYNFAAYVFTVFICDDMFRVADTAPNNIKRYFAIATQLPIELQAHLATFGIITSQEFRTACCMMEELLY
jgi:hypothetical protein